MSRFVLSEQHSQRLFGHAPADSAIVDPDEARGRLRLLPQLKSSTDAQLDTIMRALESWDLAFELSDAEKQLYGRPNGGYLFPSMRRSADMLSLPILSDPAAAAAELWLAEQVC